jgi:DNA-binding NarL/FixJ family response regulator
MEAVHTEASGTIRVGILDDHKVLTEALSLVIDAEPDMQVTGAANTCEGFADLVAAGCPDVVLLDVSLPDGDGLSVVPDCRRACPQTSILVLTSLSNEATLLRALDLGVNGFVGKNRPLSEVIAAIRRAHEGEIVMPTSMLVGLLARAQPRQPDGDPAPNGEALTAREMEVLACAAQGKSTSAIAGELHISTLTVRTHLRNLMSKLGVHSRLEAVVYALGHGLIDPPL